MARGLSLVCDALLTATVCDVIDEDEFVHLFFFLFTLLSPRSRHSTNNFHII